MTAIIDRNYRPQLKRRLAYIGGGGQGTDVDEDDQHADEYFAVASQLIRILVAQSGDHRLQSAKGGIKSQCDQHGEEQHGPHTGKLHRTLWGRRVVGVEG